MTTLKNLIFSIYSLCDSNGSILPIMRRDENDIFNERFIRRFLGDSFPLLDSFFYFTVDDHSHTESQSDFIC